MPLLLSSYTFAKVPVLNIHEYYEIAQLQCTICLPLGSWLPRYNMHPVTSEALHAVILKREGGSSPGGSSRAC